MRVKIYCDYLSTIASALFVAVPLSTLYGLTSPTVESSVISPEPNLGPIPKDAISNFGQPALALTTPSRRVLPLAGGLWEQCAPVNSRGQRTVVAHCEDDFVNRRSIVTGAYSSGYGNPQERELTCPDCSPGANGRTICNSGVTTRYFHVPCHALTTNDGYTVTLPTTTGPRWNGGRRPATQPVYGAYRNVSGWPAFECSDSVNVHSRYSRWRVKSSPRDVTERLGACDFWAVKESNSIKAGSQWVDSFTAADEVLCADLEHMYEFKQFPVEQRMKEGASRERLAWDISLHGLNYLWSSDSRFPFSYKRRSQPVRGTLSVDSPEFYRGPATTDTGTDPAGKITYQIGLRPLRDDVVNLQRLPANVIISKTTGHMFLRTGTCQQRRVAERTMLRGYTGPDGKPLACVNFSKQSDEGVPVAVKSPDDRRFLPGVDFPDSDFYPTLYPPIPLAMSNYPYLYPRELKLKGLVQTCQDMQLKDGEVFTPLAMRLPNGGSEPKDCTTSCASLKNSKGIVTKKGPHPTCGNSVYKVYDFFDAPSCSSFAQKPAEAPMTGPVTSNPLSTVKSNCAAFVESCPAKGTGSGMVNFFDPVSVSNEYKCAESVKAFTSACGPSKIGNRTITYFNKKERSYNVSGAGCLVKTQTCRLDPRRNGTVTEFSTPVNDGGVECRRRAFEIETVTCGNQPGSRLSQWRTVGADQDLTAREGQQTDYYSKIKDWRDLDGWKNYSSSCFTDVSRVSPPPKTICPPPPLVYEPIISAPTTLNFGQVARLSRTSKSFPIAVRGVEDSYGSSKGSWVEASGQLATIVPSALVTEDAEQVYFTGAHFANSLASSFTKTRMTPAEKERRILEFLKSNVHCSSNFGRDLHYDVCTVSIDFDAQNQLSSLNQKFSIPLQILNRFSGTAQTRMIEVPLLGSIVERPYPWRNSTNPLDVNLDGTVNPLDVLTLINELNFNGPRELDGIGPVEGRKTFFDVDGDGAISPLDVLTVINFLNR